MVRRTFATLGTALLVAACTTANPSAQPSAGSEPTAQASAVRAATAAPTPVAVAVRLDEVLMLADGRKIKARCVGEGTPTVLLEVGGSNDMTDWSRQFVNELGMGTTTCLYSRAGGPGSDPPAARPVSMEDVTSDAFEVLDLARTKAGVEGPYVFAGWSLGGSVALANALARPDQTVGVALLDSGMPSDFMANCLADGRTEEDCQAEFDSDIDAKFFETEIAKAMSPLDIPAVFISAMELPDCQDSPSATQSANLGGVTVVAADCQALAAAIADHDFQTWSTAFPELEQTRVDADHDGLVVAEGHRIAELILDIVEEARASL